MGYKTDYFEYIGFPLNNNKLTCENFLEKYGPERENKILRKFTRVVIKLNPDERKFFTEFLKIIGYEMINGNEYVSPGNFGFLIFERQLGDQNTLESIEFETSKEFLSEKEVKISENITIRILGNLGQIFFK